ncbi:unnamed protein product, partial [Allacma fusca]
MEPARKQPRLGLNLEADSTNVLILKTLNEIKTQNESMIGYLVAMDKRLKELESRAVARQYNRYMRKQMILNSKYRYGQGHAELHQEAQRRSMKANPNDTHPNVSAALRSNFVMIAEFYRSYCKRLQDRQQDMNNQMALNLGKQSFSLESILNSPTGDRILAFEQYCQLAIIWEFIPSVKPTEKEFWQKFISSDEYSKAAPIQSKEIIHLLLTALVRNKSECIAETVGSLIKGRLRGRGSLSNDAMRQELFLDFNGPPTHRECH